MLIILKFPSNPPERIIRYCRSRTDALYVHNTGTDDDDVICSSTFRVAYIIGIMDFPRPFSEPPRETSPNAITAYGDVRTRNAVQREQKCWPLGSRRTANAVLINLSVPRTFCGRPSVFRFLRRRTRARYPDRHVGRRPIRRDCLQPPVHNACTVQFAGRLERRHNTRTV